MAERRGFSYGGIMQEFMSGNAYWLGTLAMFVMCALWIETKGYDE